MPTKLNYFAPTRGSHKNPVFNKTNYMEVPVFACFPSHELPEEMTINKDMLLAAAVEVGYSKGQDLRLFKYTGSEINRLAKFLSLRAQSLVAGLKINNAGEVSLETFMEALETTEKATNSYYYGMMFAYLATHHWLPYHNRPRRILHLSTFTNAKYIKQGALLLTSNQSNLLPDLVCEDWQHHWHIIEAKGGVIKNRSEVVTDALSQLRAITQIGQLGAPCVKPLSSTCVHVAVDQNPWSVSVIDPEPQGEIEISLLPDIAEIRLAALQLRVLKEASKTISFSQMTLSDLEKAINLFKEYDAEHRIAIYDKYSQKLSHFEFKEHALQLAKDLDFGEIVAELSAVRLDLAPEGKSPVVTCGIRISLNQ